MTKLQETIKEETIQAIRDHWRQRIGSDHDQGSSTPEWEEIKKIIQAVREYNANPETCEHNYNVILWGEEKGLSVCDKCGSVEYTDEEE